MSEGLDWEENLERTLIQDLDERTGVPTKRDPRGRKKRLVTPVVQSPQFIAISPEQVQENRRNIIQQQGDLFDASRGR